MHLAQFVTHFVAFTVGLVAGAVGWYKYGSHVAADASVIRDAARRL